MGSDFSLGKNKNSARRSSRNANRGPAANQSQSRAATEENRSAWRMVRSMQGSNHKYINPTYGNINVTGVLLTSPYSVCLNAVAQGTGENARLGRLAKMLWLDMDLDFYAGAFAAASLVRYYIIVETTALGSAIAPSQFFVDAANFHPTSQRDRTNRNASRYMVLYDSKPFVLGGLPTSDASTNSFSNVGVAPAEKAFSHHLPLNFETDYSRGNTGTITDIDTNSLYLLVVTDVASGNNVNVVGTSCLCFSDMPK